MAVAPSARIHPAAIIDPRADIGDEVQIGPFVVVDGPVRIGPGTTVRSHCSLLGNLTIGSGNDVGIGVVLGERPQHLGYKDEETRTEIGDYNIFREYVTIHRGTSATGTTIVGDHNLIMAYSHIAHDCRVGNHAIMVNGAQLAGHAVLEDRAFLSGNTGVHQFARLGRLSFLSGLSSLTRDLLPFMLAFGRDVVAGINKVGMRRAGMSPDDIRAAQQCHQIIYRSGLIKTLAVQKLEREMGHHPIAAEILEFIRTSKRGFVGPKCDPPELAEAA